MPESPLTPSPYAVLGVSEHASDSDLRRAYRRKLRETHPDTGGEAARFDLIQRAWEQLGTPVGRAAYDSGARRGSRADSSGRTWAPQAPSPRMGSSRPESLMYGHPGRWDREQYLELLHEWVGPGVDIPDPYEPKLVRSTPREIRQLLASAIAEEDTAVVLAGLGMGFTVWNDVRTDPGDLGSQGAAGKLDHLVLGPTGLWGILSEDWGGSVASRRGELIGREIGADSRPMHDLAGRARRFERQANVRVSALAIVVPDDTSREGVEIVGAIRNVPTILVERSRLANLIRARQPGVAFGGTDLFEVRTRVQSAARFVQTRQQ